MAVAVLRPFFLTPFPPSRLPFGYFQSRDLLGKNRSALLCSFPWCGGLVAGWYTGRRGGRLGRVFEHCGASALWRQFLFCVSAFFFNPSLQAVTVTLKQGDQLFKGGGEQCTINRPIVLALQHCNKSIMNSHSLLALVASRHHHRHHWHQHSSVSESRMVEHRRCRRLRER